MAVFPLPKQARILVIIVSRIGDTVLTTPAIRALKTAYPESEITVAAHPKRMAVFLHLPFITRVIALEKRRALFLGYLTPKSYHLALVYEDDAALFQYALRVAQQVITLDSPHAPQHPRLQSVSLPNTPEYNIAAKRRLYLVESLGIDTQNLQLAYQVSAKEHAWARQWLQQKVNKPDSLLIALQTLSFHTKPQRNWPMSSFSALLGKIIAAYPTAHFMILGDQQAARQTQVLCERYPQSTTVLAGTVSLRESVAVMAQCHAYIGVDTGPTHIAGALGLPMLVLYHADFPAQHLLPQQHEQCLYLQSAQGEALTSIAAEAVFIQFQALMMKREKQKKDD